MSLKLFVWDAPGHLKDYTDGIAFALAENEDQARALIDSENGWKISDRLPAPEVFDGSQPCAFVVWGGG